MICNNWNDIVDLVWEKFSKLNDETQVNFVEMYSNGDKKIISSSKFSDFCKEHFAGNYLKVAQMAVDGSQNNNFDCYKLWCCYKEDEELLETGDTPADFVEDDDLFVENILEDKIPALEKLGFTKEEAKDLYEVYQDL